MNRFDATIIGYSLLLILGGVIGYLAAGSVMSLLMSAISAILLMSSLFIIRLSPIAGYRVTFVLLSVLTLFFAYRWYLTNKFMPSGLITLLSLGVLGFTLYLRARNKEY